MAIPQQRIWVMVFAYLCGGPNYFFVRPLPGSVAKEAERQQASIEQARRNASMVTVLLPYLASPEQKQWQLAIEVTKYLKLRGELPGELESALMGIVKINDSTSQVPGEQAKINAAARVIDIEANPASEKNKSMSSTLPPRVYIQIADKSQDIIAKQVQKNLQSQNYLAPGIENVGRKPKIMIPSRTEVRFYREEEREEALAIIALLKSMDLDIALNDPPQKIPGDGRGTRPRHYEIWMSRK